MFVNESLKLLLTLIETHTFPLQLPPHRPQAGQADAALWVISSLQLISCPWVPREHPAPSAPCVRRATGADACQAHRGDDRQVLISLQHDSCHKHSAGGCLF